MCQQWTILAQQGDVCSIAQCEHGTVHLRWPHLSLHLCPQDFLEFARIVVAAYGERPQPNPKMRLSIDTFTLEVGAKDAQPLLVLIQQATAQLATPVAARFQFETVPSLLSTVQSVN
jgi:hypothetical protein